MAFGSEPSPERTSSAKEASAPSCRCTSMRMVSVMSFLHVCAATEAGEDLAALGVVPVADRVRDRVRLRGPGTSAQHAVGAAEELLRVLAVGERAKAVVR